MQAFIFRHATALTTALFSVIGLSGVALFYRLQTPLIKPMHEWLGLALVVVAGLHVWRNWVALRGYFRRGALSAPFALALLAGGGFVVASARAPAHPDPAKRVLRALGHAPLAQVAPLFHADAEALASRLRDKGFSVASTAQNLAQIGETNGLDEREILAAVLEATKMP